MVTAVLIRRVGRSLRRPDRSNRNSTRYPLILLISLQLFVMPMSGLHAAVCHTGPGHFRIEYTQVNPPAGENPLKLPPGYSPADCPGNHPDYVVKLGCWLEYAHARYADGGFRLPNQTIVVRISDATFGNPAVVPNVVLVGPLGVPVPDPLTIYVRTDLSMGVLAFLAAHELFHVVQLQYWQVYPIDFPWLIEGTAEAMACTVYPDDYHIESYFFHSNGYGMNHDWFWDCNGDLDQTLATWSQGYVTALIWLYLMEHNDPGPVSGYPGYGFIRTYLEASVEAGLPPDPLGLLEDLLAERGTSLDREMEAFAYANLVRVYDNLDYTHDHGYRWDDAFFDAEQGDWDIGSVVDVAFGADGRKLSLENFGDSASWIVKGGYTNTRPDNVINLPYGAQYWVLEANLRRLTDTCGSLSYGGPGIPYCVDVSLSDSVDYLALAALREENTILHHSGSPATPHTTRLRLDDDRLVNAAVAVTKNTEVPPYTFGYTIQPFSITLPFHQTVETWITPHQVLMYGLNHTGDALSAVVYPKEAFGRPHQYQMNFRRRDGYWYVNHEGTLVNPAHHSHWTHTYVQKASPGDYRLDLRQDWPDAGDILITLFDYDIQAAARPDLLVRKAHFSLDRSGLLTGQVAILNQGTARAMNARVPIFVDDTLITAPTVSLDPGETELIDVQHRTLQSCPRNPAGWTILSVDVTVWVNSNQGLTSGKGNALPALQPELTRNNNGPLTVHAGHVCSEGLFEQEIGDFLNDLAYEAVQLHRDFSTLQADMAGFGLNKTQGFVNRLTDLLVNPGDLPIPVPVRRWQTLDTFEWFRAVYAWFDDMGIAVIPSPLTEALIGLRNPDEITRLPHIVSHE